MWRQLGFQTLQSVEATYAGGTVTVVVNTGSASQTYTMDLQGNVIGATPTPNPFGGNADKNKWLRITNIAPVANRRNADKLVLFKEALGDTKQVIDAKLFLGNRGGSGCVFTSDNVVLLMSLAANVGCCAGILKGASDPTKQLHQGMTYLPTGSIDPITVKAGFRKMCAEYNAKQVHIILAGLSSGFISVDGDDKALIDPSLAKALEKVDLFMTSILTFLDTHIFTLDIPTFKQLCVSGYIVNIVSQTSKGFKVNQYKTLLKPNSKFTKRGIVFPTDPLVGITARKIPSSSKRRTRKSRRRRQRGGEVEKPVPRGEGGFLSSTQSFYEIADSFQIGDNEDIYDFLGFCYPYYEYVGECGAHETMIRYLLNFYDSPTDLSEYDLDQFEQVYLKELRQQTEQALLDDIRDAEIREDEDKYAFAADGGDDGNGGDGGGGAGGGPSVPPVTSAHSGIMSQETASTPRSVQSSVEAPSTLNVSASASMSYTSAPQSPPRTGGEGTSSAGPTPRSIFRHGPSISGQFHGNSKLKPMPGTTLGGRSPISAPASSNDEVNSYAGGNDSIGASSASAPSSSSAASSSSLAAVEEATSNNEITALPSVVVTQAAAGGGGGPPGGGGGAGTNILNRKTFPEQTVRINHVNYTVDVTDVLIDGLGRVRSTGWAIINNVPTEVKYIGKIWIHHLDNSINPYSRKRGRKSRNNRKKTIKRRRN